MLELFFLMFLLTQNLFWALGVLTFTGFCGYMVYCAFWTASYKVFSSYWWMEMTSLYTYTNPIYSAYNRLRYGCSYDDAWGFDTYLLKMLPVGLKHIREGGFDDDESRLSEKDWNDMIGGIEAYRHVHDCDYDECPYSHTKLEQDFDYAMFLLTKHFDQLWI